MSAPKALIKSWVELITTLKTIYDGDKEPTAPRANVAKGVTSYAAIGFVSETTDYSTAHERTTDTPGDLDATKVKQHRSLPTTGQLDVEVYGPGAVDYCRAMKLSIGRADVLRQLEVDGDFAIDNPSEISDEPILRSATREPNASISFEVKWIDTAVFETEGVDTITLTVAATPDGE